MGEMRLRVGHELALRLYDVTVLIDRGVTSDAPQDLSPSPMTYSRFMRRRRQVESAIAIAERVSSVSIEAASPVELLN